MFINRAAIEEVGFVASYFLGAEDLDLCVRMSRGGYRVACDGRVGALHAHSAEIGTLWNYYGPRNTLWFARKHYSVFRRVAIGIGLRRLRPRHRRRRHPPPWARSDHPLPGRPA